MSNYLLVLIIFHKIRIFIIIIFIIISRRNTGENNTYIKEVTVEFDDGRRARFSYENMDELEHAYAVTIHKSQGSEYPVVILPILPGPRMLMSRNLLYTGITRAKECVIIIGSSETVGSMISQDMIQRRYTSLNEKLIEISKRGMHDF